MIRGISLLQEISNLFKLREVQAYETYFFPTKYLFYTKLNEDGFNVSHIYYDNLAIYEYLFIRVTSGNSKENIASVLDNYEECLEEKHNHMKKGITLFDIRLGITGDFSWLEVDLGFLNKKNGEQNELFSKEKEL